MKMIDCHVHLPRETNSIEDALQILDREYANLPIDEVMLIDHDGSFLADPCRWDREIESLELSVGIIPLATQESLEEIRRFSNRIRGIKVHPRLQQVSINSEFLASVVECARHLQKPVVIDTLLQSASIPLREIDPYLYDDLAKENRDVIFVLAHACWPKLLDGYILARSNENVYLDLSYFARVGMGTSIVEDFSLLLSTLDKKIIYGSDYPHVSPSSYLSSWNEYLCHLDEGKRENIFFLNARRVFGS